MKSWKNSDEEQFPCTSTRGIFPVPVSRYAISSRSVFTQFWLIPGRSHSLLIKYVPPVLYKMFEVIHCTTSLLLCARILAKADDIPYPDLRVVPVPAILFNQFVGFGWPPGACRVGVDGIGRHGLPDVGDAVDDLPGSLDLVAANEKRGVALHGVGDQAFVSFRRFDAEGAAVVEIHIDRGEVAFGPWNLGAEANGDALIWLDADDNEVGFQPLRVRWPVEQVGDALELDGDFGAASRETFAVAQVEGDASPAPVLNEEFEGDVGLRRRIGRHAFFLLVARHLLFINYPGSVLAAHRVLLDLFRGETWDGM